MATSIEWEAPQRDISGLLQLLSEDLILQLPSLLAPLLVLTLLALPVLLHSWTDTGSRSKP
jgi:hypothetical protein